VLTNLVPETCARNLHPKLEQESITYTLKKLFANWYQILERACVTPITITH